MSLAGLHQLLRVASHLLDQGASDVRESGLEPIGQNVERIGRALIEIIEVQRVIHAKEPGLKPKALAASPTEAAANQLFTRFMIEALELEDAGKPRAARDKYQRFVTLSRTFAHREIARAQIRRLE